MAAADRSHAMKRNTDKSNGAKARTSKTNGRAVNRPSANTPGKSRSRKGQPEVVVESTILIEEIAAPTPAIAQQTELLTLPEPVQSLDERAAALQGILDRSQPSHFADPDLAPFPTNTAAAHDRLARYLNEAWSVEKTLVEALQEMVEDVVDSDLQVILQEHRAVTDRQRIDLGERLKRMGKQPSASGGVFNQIISWLREVLRSKPKDDGDRLLQHVIKGYAIEHLEIAMYEAIFTCAQLANDDAVAELAGQHLQEERDAAEKLRPFIRSAAAWAMSLPESGS
jgi:ferritin-like metal-binding protein YciE